MRHRYRHRRPTPLQRIIAALVNTLAPRKGTSMPQQPKHAIEIVGGPSDGAFILIEAAADPQPLPTHLAGAPLRRRPDGRLYIEWHEVIRNLER